MGTIKEKNCLSVLGFTPNLHDVAYNFADRVSSINFGSSIDVVGPEWGTIPMIVDCYEHVEFRGKKITILRDIANLRDPQGGTWFEDRISSIRIFKGPNFPQMVLKLFSMNTLNLKVKN